MVTGNRLLEQLLNGQSDSSIPYDPLLKLLKSLGLEWAHQGTRNFFFYRYAGQDFLIVVEPQYGDMAQPSDVENVRDFLLKYNIVG